MKIAVKVVKRGERETANNSVSAVVPREIQGSTPEMIVKGWITAARERGERDYLRDLRRWEENRNAGVAALATSTSFQHR